MSMQKSNLVFTGRFVDGVDAETVYENLAGVFKTDVERVKAKFVPGTRVIIKNGAEIAVCEKMQNVLQNAGALCEIIANDSEEPDTFAPEPPQPPPVSEPVASPEADRSVNPYSAPKSDIRVQTSGDEPFTGPHSVPAGNGFAWVSKGVSLFLRSPISWILAALLYLIMNLIQIIPFLGPFVFMLIVPHLVAGFLAGAKELDEDDIKPSAACIFKGFNLNGGPLVLVGLSLLGVSMIIGVLMVIVMMISMGVGFMDFGDPAAMSSAPSPEAILLPILIVLLLVIPISMCYWFAIPLVAFDDKNVFEAFGLSFRACMKNILPFLIYGLVLFLLYIILAVVAAIAIPQFAGPGGGAAVIVLLVLFGIFMLCLMPVGFASMYASYKDIFYGDHA